MIFNDKTFTVIVKNRQVDYNRNIINTFINTKIQDTFKNGGECCICMKKIKPYEISPCFTCSNFVCGNCDKICSRNCAFQCPVCRVWKLDGPNFGIPLEKPLDINLQQNTKSQFSKIIGMLDGKTWVVPRMNNRLLYDNDLFSCRYSFTTTYDDDGLTASEMARFMYDLYKEALSDVNMLPFSFYLIRETYAIDTGTNKPIAQISHLEWSDDGLIQFEKEAWNENMLLEHIGDKANERTFVKVDLLEPKIYQIPQKFSVLFSTIKRDYDKAFRMTISVIGTKTQHCMNFDVNEKKEIDTMNPQLMARSLNTICDFNKELYVTARMYMKNNKNNKNDTTVVEYIVWKTDNECDDVIKLNKKQTKKFYNANFDGLKCPRIDVVFG
jgi:hypothetical protein